MARVLAAVTDLFFKARISATALQVGAEVFFATTVDAMRERADAGPVDLVVVDLNAQGLDAVALVRALREEPMLADVPILGFLSHVQTALRDAALAAGATAAWPRSRFVEALPRLLEARSVDLT